LRRGSGKVRNSKSLRREKIKKASEGALDNRKGKGSGQNDKVTICLRVVKTEWEACTAKLESTVENPIEKKGTMHRKETRREYLKKMNLKIQVRVCENRTSSSPGLEPGQEETAAHSDSINGESTGVRQKVPGDSRRSTS